MHKAILIDLASHSAIRPFNRSACRHVEAGGLSGRSTDRREGGPNRGFLILGNFPTNFKGSWLREIGVSGAGVPRVLRQRQKPAAAGLTCFFESNNFHSFSGAPELFPGESVRTTSFKNEGCRRRSVCQNVRQEGLQAGFYSSPSELWFGLFDRWRPSALRRSNMSLATAVILGLFIVIAAITFVVSTSLGSASLGSIAIDLL